MAKHKIIKQRIDKIAKELQIFTTDDIYYKMNNHPNNKGVLYADRRRVTKNRLCALLRMNKNIVIIRPHRHNGGKNQIWGYVEEEE